MDLREIVDAQVDGRKKTVTIQSLTTKLNEKKVKALLKKKGYPVTAFKALEQSATTL